MIRQPVHTVYGGAHLFKADTFTKLGRMALGSLDRYAPDGGTFAKALGLPDSFPAQALLDRVRAKLTDEPVEDYRIDFEDGYGYRSDTEEDAHAVAAAKELASAYQQRSLPWVAGIRIKAFTPELFLRASRTLNLFFEILLLSTDKSLPERLVVTLPKVTHPEQVQGLVQLLAEIEARNSLKPGSIGIELMIETPQAILGRDGRSPLQSLVEAAEGRCKGVHFGAYDYTAALGITAAHQTLDHPACDFARQMMQVALAGSGIALSDGATTVLPIPPHRGENLSAAQSKENLYAVHHAWRLSYESVRHGMRQGFYQGWDLHPAQLPARYAAVFVFFQENRQAASDRLRNFIERAAQATTVGNVFDDAASGQGLLNYFLRGLACGAVTEEELKETSLSPRELASRSFSQIVRDRAQAGSSR